MIRNNYMLERRKTYMGEHDATGIVIWTLIGVAMTLLGLAATI
jgi:hypothetical protein